MKKVFSILSVIASSYTCSCQPPSANDSLKKYSYLLIEANFSPSSFLASPDINSTNVQVQGYGTCFFVRKNGRTYLGSAYHIFSGIDVYRKYKTAIRVTHVIVRVPEAANTYKFIYVPVYSMQQDSIPCFWLERSDVEFIDVTALTSGLTINSIENICFKPSHLENKKQGKVIAYGFAGNCQLHYKTEKEYWSAVLPSPYEGYIADSTHYGEDFLPETVDSLYETLTPMAIAGTSGSPVFLIRTQGSKKILEFLGVQSGASFQYNSATIVNRQEVLRRLKLHYN